MINAIEIKNFKSAEKLDLEFGRVNTFIGENGSGKSTILEALAFAVAAENDKLDTEFLEIRGIRVTESEFMRSQFYNGGLDKPIEIKLSVGEDKIERKYIVENKNKMRPEWEVSVVDVLGSSGALVDHELASNLMEQELTEIPKMIAGFEAVIDEGRLKSGGEKEVFQSIKEEFRSAIVQAYINSKLAKGLSLNFKLLQNFAIYAPENKQLRNLSQEGYFRPVGVQGQGLFRLLRQIAKEQPEALVDIEEGLKLIGWYESMDLENEPELIEDELFIKDRFLSKPFTQRSANEGFLYVLFYISLIVSEATPKIFAIDNLDSALNPKLCTKLMKYIYTLACKYDKQIFLTTHNPALLDGINLNDDQQKLFVVSRAKKGGQTRVKALSADKKPVDSEGKPLPLSEAMLRGYIGGLPKGF